MALAHFVRIRPRAGAWGDDTPSFTEDQPWERQRPSNGTAIPFYPHGHEEVLANGKRNPHPCRHVHTACRACVGTWDEDYEVSLTIADGRSVADVVLADRAAWGRRTLEVTA